MYRLVRLNCSPIPGVPVLEEDVDELMVGLLSMMGLRREEEGGGDYDGVGVPC